jgi:hypothetical protein
MSIVSLDDLSLCGLARIFKFLPKNTLRLAYGMLGHLPIHLTDQHMVA